MKQKCSVQGISEVNYFYLPAILHGFFGKSSVILFPVGTPRAHAWSKWKDYLMEWKYF